MGEVIVGVLELLFVWRGGLHSRVVVFLTSVKLFVVAVVASVGTVVVVIIGQFFKSGEEDMVTVVVAEGVGVVKDNGWFKGRSVLDGGGGVVENKVLGGPGGHVDEWEGGVEQLFERRG